MVKLAKLLFEGTGPITQLFGNKLIINGVDIYAQYGLMGHNGVDFGLPNGRKLYSCINGRVIRSEKDPANNYTGGFGNYVQIENDECGVVYAHQQSMNVHFGDTVKAGDVIGWSDNTGNSTGPHLHFGVYPIPRNRNNGYNGYINPFDKTKVEWVDIFEEQITEDKIENIGEDSEVTDTVNVVVKETDKEIGVTEALLIAIVNLIKKLWESIVRSILG